MVNRFELQSGDLVADIGSNDGTCLSFFKEQGMTIVGVDPATDIAERATEMQSDLWRGEQSPGYARGCGAIERARNHLYPRHPLQFRSNDLWGLAYNPGGGPDRIEIQSHPLPRSGDPAASGKREPVSPLRRNLKSGCPDFFASLSYAPTRSIERPIPFSPAF